jgi:RNA polymerase sigma factor (sigma-70 family)
VVQFSGSTIRFDLSRVDTSRVIGSFLRWLFRIATNVLRKHWKEKGRKKEKNLGESDESVVDWQTESEAEVSFEDASDGASFVNANFDCLMELPQDQRDVMVLSMAGLSLQEIADTLAIPYGTAGTRLHHARRKMEECLKGKGFSFVPPGQVPNGAMVVMRIKSKGEKHPQQLLICHPPPKEG